jgi:hypothetical protein
VLHVSEGAAMLCDQLIDNLKASFYWPKLLWLKQCDSETSPDDDDDKSQNIDEAQLKMQLIGRRKRLRRMQTQNFVVRTAYSVAELFHVIAHNQEAS